MKKSSKETYWAFVVDTDEYSGNFQGELACYIVGEDDQFNRYEHLVGLFDEECANSEHRDIYNCVHYKVIDPGDDGIYRGFVDIWPTLGFFNNGLGGCFAHGQEEAAVKHYNEERVARSYYADRPPMTLETLKKHDAYQSVAIFFDKELSPSEIAFLDERARRFSKIPKENKLDSRPNILGTRFIKIVETMKETEVWKSQP